MIPERLHNELIEVYGHFEDYFNALDSNDKIPHLIQIQKMYNLLAELQEYEYKLVTNQ